MERSPPNDSPLVVRKRPPLPDTRRKPERRHASGHAVTFPANVETGERSRKEKESPDRCNRSSNRKQPWRSLCTRPCRVEKTPRARLRAKPNLRITVRPQEQIAQFSEPSGNSVPASHVSPAQSPAKFPAT